VSSDQQSPLILAASIAGGLAFSHLEAKRNEFVSKQAAHIKHSIFSYTRSSTNLAMTIGTNVLLVLAAGHDERKPKEGPKHDHQDNNGNNAANAQLFLQNGRARMRTVRAGVIGRQAAQTRQDR